MDPVAATLREWIAARRNARQNGGPDLGNSASTWSLPPKTRASRLGGAARAAHRRAGGIAQAMEALRDQRGLPWLDGLARDVRHGCRVLAGSPGFTAIAVMSIALGTGANVAIFSATDALLLRPLPIVRPGELMTVGKLA